MNRHSVVKGILALAITTPALALGAVHSVVLAGYLVLAAALYIYLVIDSRDRSFVRLDLPSVILLVMALFTGFQLLPLPSGMVEFLSPNAYEIRARALEPLGLGAPSFMPLTLDGTLTLTELAKLFFYLAVYWTCAAWTRRNGPSAILKMVMAAGVMASFVLLAHKILILEKIYGFYEPLHLGNRGERVSAPLLNENHMAAMLSLSAAVAIGLAASAEERSKRLLMTFIAALIGGCVLLTLSRGGIAAFVAGQLVFVVLRLVYRALSKKGKDQEKKQIAWLPLGLALSLGLGLFAAYDVVFAEFTMGDHKKVEMLTQGLPLVGDFPAVGVGRGAFWVGFSLVSDWAATVTFTHAENVVVQLLVDYGVVLGSVFLLGFGLIMARRLVKNPGSVRISAMLAALVAFGLHNLVDFNIEIPGVAVLAVAILGSLEGGWRDTQRRTRKRSPRVPVALAYGLGACALAMAVGVGIYAASHNVDTEERNLRTALADKDTAAFESDNIKGLLERHPASWYIPFLAGVQQSRIPKGEPLPWFARSLEVNPWSASTHFHVAQALRASGHVDQAVLEFRVAVRAKPGLASSAAKSLVSTGKSFAQLTAGEWPDSDKKILWESLATAFSAAGNEEEARKGDEAVLGLKVPGSRSLARHAERLSKEGRYEEALMLAAKLDNRERMGPSAAVLKGRIKRAMKDPQGEVETLRAARARWPKDRNLLNSLAWAYQRNGQHEPALETARDLSVASYDASSRAAAIALEGDLERSEGRNRAALASYRKAYAQAPSNVRLLKKIADLAEDIDDPAVALEALRKLVNLEPGNSEWEERLKNLENSIRNKKSSQ